LNEKRMKGSFLVAFVKSYVFNPDGSVDRPWNDTEVHENVQTFIPKKDVVCTYKYDTLKKHRLSEKSNVFGTQCRRDYYREIHYRLDEKLGCTCGVEEYAKFLWNPEEGKAPPPEGNWDCTCPSLPNVLPLYEIVVKNHVQYDECDGKPKYARYLVHPSEREHMERFLSGTDDAVHDLVHLLRYAPPSTITVVQGSEAAEAAERFNKKIKI